MSKSPDSQEMGLTTRQLAAVRAAMENAEHDAADFDDGDEDQANARDLHEGLQKLLGTVANQGPVYPLYPRDDVEAAVLVLKVLHQGSAEACAKDGRTELSNVHLDAVKFLDYALALHLAHVQNAKTFKETPNG